MQQPDNVIRLEVKKMTKSENYNWLGWIVCTIGALFYCYEYLLRITPSTMVPELMHAFSIERAETFSLIFSFYYFAYVPMQAVVGVANDVFGPRRILIFAITLCILGSLLFESTHSLYPALIARFVIGLGSAFAFVSALKLASLWLPANRFGFFVGMITALGMLGGMVGNILITHLVTSIGWNSTLTVGTVAGVVMLPVLWFGIREKVAVNNQAVTVDYKAIIKGFLRLLKMPQMWIVGIIGCMLYLSLSIFAESWGNEFLHRFYGFSYERASIANSMIYLGWLLGGPLMGFISDRLQLRRPLLIYGSIAAAIAMMVVLYIPGISAIAVLAILLFYGVFCSTQNVCFAVGLENASRELAGSAVALINMFVMLGGMVLQPLVGKLLDMHWQGAMQGDIRIYSAFDYRFALTMIPIGLIISAILTKFLRETHAKVGNH